MSSAGTEFEAWFHETFGAPCPVPLDLPVTRGPIGEHFASEVRPELMPDALMVPTFPAEPRAYVVVGRWGHGLTRQAFYFTSRRPIEHPGGIAAGPPGSFEVFFRVSFGNAYGDADDPAAEVVSFLRGYANWLTEEGATIRFGRVTYSMGTGSYEIGLADGAAVRVASGRIPLAPNGAVLPPSAVWPRLADQLRSAAPA